LWDFTFYIDIRRGSVQVSLGQFSSFHWPVIQSPTALNYVTTGTTVWTNGQANSTPLCRDNIVLRHVIIYYLCCVIVCRVQMLCSTPPWLPGSIELMTSMNDRFFIHLSVTC